MSAPKPDPGARLALAERGERVSVPDLAAFFSLIVLAAFLWLWHSPWLDELQGLAIARSDTLAILFQRMRFEGHPPLWHLVAFGLEKIAPGFSIIRLLHFGLLTSSLAFVWFTAPFAFWARLLIGVNTAVFFTLGGLARSYGLGEALFFLWLGLRNKPGAWLILALLPFVAMTFALLAAALAVYLAHRRRLGLTGLALVLAAVALSLVLFRPAPGFHAPLVPDAPLSAFVRSGVLLFPYEGQPLALVAAALLAPALILLGLRRRPLAALLTLGLLLALIVISAALYPMSYYHYAAVWLCLIGFAWLLKDEGLAVEKEPAMAALLFLGAAVGAVQIGAALTLPASHALLLKGALERQGLKAAPLIAYPGEMAVELAFASDAPQLDAERGCRAFMAVWDHPVAVTKGAALTALIPKLGEETSGRVLLYTSTRVMDRNPQLPHRALTHFGRDLRGEDFELFALQLPKAPRSLAPLCPEAMAGRP